MASYQSCISYRLICAVRDGRLETVSELISEYGLSYSAAWSDGYVLLRDALEYRHSEISKLLLKNNCKVNSRIHKHSVTPLHIAARNYDIEIIEMLLDRGAHINAENAYGSTPLDIASDNKHMEIVEILLNKGASFTDRNTYGAILLTAVEIGYLQLVEYLLNTRACIDSVLHTSKFSRKGYTPLCYAAKKGNEVMMKFLLSKGANIDSKTSHGETPLYLAVEKGHEEIVMLLLKNGANINAQTQNGETALHFATRAGNVNIVETLLQYNANVNSTLKNDVTLLHIAAKAGNEVITKMLLHKGANINARQENRKTALHIATLRCHKEVVEVLLRCGAKVDLKMNNHLTPLHIAAHNGCLKIVELLLKFGADVDSRNINGETALHIASFRRYSKIVTALLNYGSDINIISKNNPLPIAFLICLIDFPYAPLLDNYDSDDHDDISDCDHDIKQYVKTYCVLISHKFGMETANRLLNRKLAKKYKEEIARMKSDKISNLKVSFYDILTKGINQLVIYAANENIVRVLGSEVYKKKYPMYAGKIQGNFMKGKRRKELLEQGYQYFHFTFNSLPHLPYNCTEKIFSYISDEDLRFLFEDFRTEEGRKELLEQGYRFFHLSINIPQLPYNCTEKIFSYLNDEDLRNLIIACKPINIH